MKYLACVCLLFCSLLNLRADDEFPQLSDLPTLYIETENHKSIPDKNSDYVKAVLTLVDGDKITVYDALGIRGRGNSTWNLEKKPYKLKFDKKQEFLGSERANAKSWTLLANHSDKTLMRNAVAAFIGKFAGQPFTAAAKFVDVVLNGNYVGNYQISDQIEVRKKRVDITEQEEGLDASHNISGGYLLEVDGFASQEASHFYTNKRVAITIKSPDEDVISNAQSKYIRDYINKFEASLFSSDFKDPEKGYRPYVDESTLASWYISSELTGNVDCFWSTYIYKEKDDPKIYWGPLWDYDIAFNNCVRVGSVTNSLMMDKGFGDDLTKLWMRQMWKDPWFINLISNRWVELIDAGMEEAILDYIDDTSALLEKSQLLNFKKWKINQRAYDELILFSTYREGVEYLKDFVSRHISYLSSTFENASSQLVPLEEFNPDPEYFYTIANKGVGSLADIDSKSALCIKNQDDKRHSQHWRFIEDGKGNYQIINCEKNLAISESAVLSGADYSKGPQIVLKEPDITDPRQLWNITPASPEAGMGYVITSVLSGNAWNNNGGSSDDYNPIITWYNDKDNPDKPTRQWNIRPIHEIANDNDDDNKDDDSNSIDQIPSDNREYFITYDKQNGILHFISSDGGGWNNSAVIYTLDGRKVMEFMPREDVDISRLLPGYYVLTWQSSGKTRSLKFVK